MTLANKVTSLRFIVSVVYFVLLGIVVTDPRGPSRTLLLDVSFILFLIAAFGDLLDGYLARRYGEVTLFGRIADPFVDKILVCGSFTFFLSIPPLGGYFYAWFVVVILAREFLVQGIRSALEASGVAFGATFWGKLKTLVQNTTVGTALCYAAHFEGTRWTEQLTMGLMGLTLLATVASGVVYLSGAKRLLGGKGI